MVDAVITTVSKTSFNQWFDFSVTLTSMITKDLSESLV
jgi:hypothetical protein